MQFVSLHEHEQLCTSILQRFFPTHSSLERHQLADCLKQFVFILRKCSTNFKYFHQSNEKKSRNLALWKTGREYKRNKNAHKIPQKFFIKCFLIEIETTIQSDVEKMQNNNGGVVKWREKERETSRVHRLNDIHTFMFIAQYNHAKCCDAMLHDGRHNAKMLYADKSVGACRQSLP